MSTDKNGELENERQIVTSRTEEPALYGLTEEEIAIVEWRMQGGAGIPACPESQTGMSAPPSGRAGAVHHFNLYRAQADTVLFFDNTDAKPVLIFKDEGGETVIRTVLCEGGEA